MKVKRFLGAILAGTMVIANAGAVFAETTDCEGGHIYTKYVNKCAACGEVSDHECVGIYHDSDIDWNGNCLED